MNDMLITAPRPWIVLDWGAICGYTYGDVAADCSFVICDTLFLEAVDVEPARRTQMMQKLREFLEHPGVVDRVLYSRPWHYLSKRERTPRDRRAVGPDLIDIETTLRMRKHVQAGEDWPTRALVGRDSQDFKQYLEGKEKFVQSCNEYADHPTNQPVFLRLRPSNWALVGDWVTDPDRLPEFVAELRNGIRYRSSIWRKELRRFPDRTAVARLHRCIAWYGIQRVIQRDMPDGKFSNNYEDSKYAFLASYMFEIATTDKGIVSCVCAIFPGVRVRAGIGGSPGA